jgi:hypothetical protein
MENAPGLSRAKPSQYRVIDGTLYARHPVPYSHDIRVHDLGHGHLEALVMPRYGWSEVGMLSPSALADKVACEGSIWVDGAWAPAPPPSASELLDKAALNLERSSRRAKTKVRRLCKAKALTTMVTLTYRDNMQDRARMARDFDVFVKRVRRVISGFQYVCVFERQKRGAWHAHIAVPRVLAHYLHQGVMVRSYDLLRSMWRGVVGVDGGNVDVSRNKRIGRSAARLASYLSKYISKGFAEALGSGDSYRASGRALPPAVVVRSAHAGLAAAIGDLCDLIRTEMDSALDFHQALLDCGGYFVSLSP